MIVRDRKKVFGAILAGGLSRRMGGGDKTLLELGGISIAERVVRRLQPQVGSLVLNANGNGARFAFLGLPIVPDNVPGFPGPLAGVLAALDHAAEHGFGHVMVVPGDAPFLPLDLVERLQQAAADKGAVAVSGERRHPAVALWPVTLRLVLRQALVEEDQRRVETFLRRHDFAETEWPAKPFDPFLNINDPEGLKGATELLRHWPEA